MSLIWTLLFLILQLLGRGRSETYGPSKGLCVYHITPSVGCSEHTSTTVLPAWLQQAGVDVVEGNKNVRRVAVNGEGITGAASVAAEVKGSFGRFGSNLKVKDLGVAGNPFFVNVEALRDDAFFIVGYQSGDCIQILEDGKDEDLEVHLGRCDMDTWSGRLVALHAREMGIAAYLIFSHSGLCLSPKGGSNEAGVILTQRPCILDDSSQMWASVKIAEDISYIVNIATGLAMQAAHHHGYSNVYNEPVAVIVAPRRDTYFVNQAWSPWADYLRSLGLTGGISQGYQDIPSSVVPTSPPRKLDVGYGLVLTYVVIVVPWTLKHVGGKMGLIASSEKGMLGMHLR